MRVAGIVGSPVHYAVLPANSLTRGIVSMKWTIIACETLRNEVSCLMRRNRLEIPVVWIPSGLHNVPATLNHTLQEALAQLSSTDYALLAMSYCGNSLTGLDSGDLHLVIPRCDDCITLLLGSPARRQSISSAYFMTEGWLNGEHNLWWEYQHCLDKYGEKRGRKIFSIMLAHYKNLALLDTGCFDKNAAQARMLPMARALGLEYTCIDGTLDYLRDLLTGAWDPERFLIVPPHTTISPDMFTLKG